MRLLVSGILMAIVFIQSHAYSQNMTLDMENFLEFASQYNGNQRGFTKEDVEHAFGINLINRKMSKGKVSYESAVQLNDADHTPVFKLTFYNNVAIILDFNFTESPKEFLYYASHLRGYDQILLPRQQANGLPIHYFEGVDIHNFIPTKKFWIRIYDCSTNHDKRCVRNAELLFAKKDRVL